MFQIFNLNIYYASCDLSTAGAIALSKSLGLNNDEYILIVIRPLAAVPSKKFSFFRTKRTAARGLFKKLFLAALALYSRLNFG